MNFARLFLMASIFTLVSEGVFAGADANANQCLTIILGTPKGRLSLFAEQLAPTGGAPLFMVYSDIHRGMASGVLGTSEERCASLSKNGECGVVSRSEFIEKGIHRMLSAAQVLHGQPHTSGWLDLESRFGLQKQAEGYLQEINAIGQIRWGDFVANLDRRQKLESLGVDLVDLVVNAFQKRFTELRMYAWKAEAESPVNGEPAPVVCAPERKETLGEYLRREARRIFAGPPPEGYSAALWRMTLAAAKNRIYETPQRFAETLAGLPLDRRMYLLNKVYGRRPKGWELAHWLTYWPLTPASMTHDEAVSILLLLPPEQQERAYRSLSPHIYTTLFMYNLLGLDDAISRVSFAAQSAIIGSLGEVHPARIGLLVKHRRTAFFHWLKTRGALWPGVASKFAHLVISRDQYLEHTLLTPAEMETLIQSVGADSTEGHALAKIRDTGTT